MKTLKELYEEILSSDELKKEFTESVKTREDAAAFLAKYECSATVDELIEFVKEQLPVDPSQLSEEELADVAGGFKWPWLDVLTTVATIFGCLVLSLIENSTDESCDT